MGFSSGWHLPVLEGARSGDADADVDVGRRCGIQMWDADTDADGEQGSRDASCPHRAPSQGQPELGLTLRCGCMPGCPATSPLSPRACPGCWGSPGLAAACQQRSVREAGIKLRIVLAQHLALAHNLAIVRALS